MYKKKDIRQILEGSADIRIPELSETATDDEIHAVLSLLEKREKTISAQRKALREYANEIFDTSDKIDLGMQKEVSVETIPHNAAEIQKSLRSCEGPITDGTLIGEC